MTKERLDPELLRRAKHHDFAAFESIIFHYEQAIFNYLYRLTGQREAAEDLTQETFIKLYKNFGAFDESKNFNGWLYQIATRTAYDWLRKSKAGREQLILDEAVDELETIEPDSAYYQIERAADLASALQKIKPLYRTVLTLYYLQGFGYQEIADILSVPLNTVKTYLHRAKHAVRDLL